MKPEGVQQHDMIALTPCSPGSRVWKVGFSGEADPRAVLWAQDDPDDTGGAVWELDLRRISGVREDRDEVSRVIAARVKQKLRETFIK